MKKYTMTVITTIWVEGDDEQVKDLAEKKAKQLGENAEIRYLGELSDNPFTEPREIINNLK